MDPDLFPYTVEIDGVAYEVLAPDSPSNHRVRLPDTQVAGVPCDDSSAELTSEALADWLANPPAGPEALAHQSTRIVVDRLTGNEREALRAAAVGNAAVFAYILKAVSTGSIRSDDPDFAEAVSALDGADIIAAERWIELLAP